jgi:hypothetical protein
MNSSGEDFVTRDGVFLEGLFIALDFIHCKLRRGDLLYAVAFNPIA